MTPKADRATALPTPLTVIDVLPDGQPSHDGPRIAVLVSLNLPGATESVTELMRRFTTTALSELHRQGASVHLFDTTADPRPDPAHIAGYDGLLLLGGGDADPKLYGVHGPVRNLYGVDRAADEHAISTIRATLARQSPLLGICRGAQMLNVACGGTLVPDLEQWSLHHGGDGESLFLNEDITIQEPSTLAAAVGAGSLTVRSGHHQAVHRVGERLVVVARADDDVIEAIEHRDSWAVGVQFHPEDDQGDPAVMSKLFAAFLHEATKRNASTSTSNTTLKAP